MNEHKDVQEKRRHLYKEVKQELGRILSYWEKKMTDRHFGGFYARRDGYDQLDQAAPKGLVLNAQILWTFSAAAKEHDANSCTAVARHAFKYLLNFFRDEVNGGVYWSVDRNGEKLDEKKHTYAQALALSGYAEYFYATGNESAKNEAIALFNLIEVHCVDPVFGGYIEVLTSDWHPQEDLRLSDKDANGPKSMRTHLHLLEAYTSLYRVWPDEMLKKRILALLELFREKIICKESGRLNLFFSMEWELRSGTVSYGYDIEAAWLLHEAAIVAGDAGWIAETRDLSLRLAEAAAHGLDADGGLWYEANPSQDHFVYEKRWWPQAEALVGFYHAWQISGEEKWLQRTIDTWNFIQQHLVDHGKGEWFWGVDQQHDVLRNEDKAGFLKSPFHHTRACLELIRRLSSEEVLT
jgi:cellobiose epimerase